MAPRTRKSTTAVRPQRQSTQFGELDTTPTSRHFESPKKGTVPGSQPSTSQHLTSQGGSREEPPLSTNEFDDGLADFDLLELDPDTSKNVQNADSQTFVWSEAGSATRRSTPVPVGETPSVRWQFGDDSLGPPSSRSSGRDKLPDTLPLPGASASEPVPNDQGKTAQHIDFSETASTVRRSSPFALDDAVREIWDFKDRSSALLGSSVHEDSGALPETLPLPQLSLPSYSPIEDIYDATPPKEQPQEVISRDEPIPAAAKSHTSNTHGPTPPKTGEKGSDIPLGSTMPLHSARRKPDAIMSHDENPGSPLPPNKRPKAIHHDEHHYPDPDHLETMATGEISSPKLPPSSLEQQRGKKRKQRAKTPLQFDEDTQEIKHSRPAKKPAMPQRMPIVSKLRDSAQPSSSPAVEAPKRPTRKTAQPKKKGKTAQPKKGKAAQPVQKKAVKSKQVKAVQQKKGKGAQSEQDEAVQSKQDSVPEPVQANTTQPSEATTKQVLQPAKTSSTAQAAPKSRPAKDVQEAPASSKQPIQDLHPEQASSLPKLRKRPNKAHTAFEIDPVFLSSDQSSDPTNDQEDGAFVPQSSAILNGANNPIDHGRAISLNPAPPEKPALRSRAQKQAREQTESPKDLKPSGILRSAPRSSKVGGTMEVYKPKAAAKANSNSAKSPTVLSVRDPNTWGKKPLGPFRKTLASKQTASNTPPIQSQMPAPRNQQKQPARNEPSRKVSIGEHGSPLRDQDHGPLPSLPFVGRLHDDINLSDSRPKSPPLVGTRLFTAGHVPGSSLSEFASIDTGPTSFQPHAADENTKPAQGSEVQSIPTFSQRQAEVPLSNLSQKRDDHGAAISDRLRAQILASLQKQDKRPAATELQSQGRVDATKSPPDVAKDHEVGQHLHRIVDIMMDNLISKEVPVQNVSEVYRTNTLDSIAQIHRRFVVERDMLEQKCKDDGRRFGRTVQQATSAIDASKQEQKATVKELEDTLTRRRLSYKDATTSLRAMHRALLNANNRED